MPLTSDELETVWSDLAEAIDAVAAERRDLFLCKFALALAREHGDPKTVRDALRLATLSLDPPRTGLVRS